MWPPTRDRYPECVAADGLHPNGLGMKIMAEGWYRTITGPETRPDIIDRLHARDYDVETMMRAYVRRRRGRGGTLDRRSVHGRPPADDHRHAA